MKNEGILVFLSKTLYPEECVNLDLSKFRCEFCELSKNLHVSYLQAVKEVKFLSLTSISISRVLNELLVFLEQNGS